MCDGNPPLAGRSQATVPGLVFFYGDDYEHDMYLHVIKRQDFVIESCFCACSATCRVIDRMQQRFD